MTAAAFPTLLSPIGIRGLRIENRIVSTAHGAFMDFYREGISADRYIAYQERRARGGCGLIILQPLHVHPSSHALGHYVPEPEDLGRKLTAMADALHAHGTRVFLQMMHFGAQFTSEARDDLEPLWSFSGTPSPEGEPSHQMTSEEIESVIAGFAAHAAIAAEAGIDGVEVHGAHGYLVQQSFSPWANARTDEWGERFRFLDAVLDAVRGAVPDDTIVGLRLAADDLVRPERGGVGVEGLREVARHVATTRRIDYLNHSEGARSSHYARAVGSYRHPRGEWLPLAAGLRTAIDGAVPVIGVGRIVDPAMAEQALADGTCDLVGLTRAQIADPDFARKCAGGGEPIRPCVGANQGCVDRMNYTLPITCFHNPDVGREHRLEVLAPAPERKRVMVVGAGPAGLTAAAIAARRGHDVTVVDRTHQPGGLLRCVSRLGAAAELLGSIEWQAAALQRLGVDLQLGTEADEALLGASAPDVVVLATGAQPDPAAPGAGDGSVPVLSTAEAAWSQWQGTEFDPADRRILVVDTLGTLETALVTESLAGRGADVTVVTPYLHFGPYVGFTHRKDLLGAVYGAGSRIETSSVFSGLEDGVARWRHVYTREQSALEVDAIVAGAPRLPDLSLVAAAGATGAAVHLAGDSVAARSAMHAFREGDNVGRAV